MACGNDGVIMPCTAGTVPGAHDEVGSVAGSVAMRTQRNR